MIDFELRLTLSRELKALVLGHLAVVVLRHCSHPPKPLFMFHLALHQCHAYDDICDIDASVLCRYRCGTAQCSGICLRVFAQLSLSRQLPCTLSPYVAISKRAGHSRYRLLDVLSTQLILSIPLIMSSFVYGL